MDIELAAGRNFYETDKSDFRIDENGRSVSKNRVLINERAAMMLGYANPEDAISEEIYFQFGQPENLAEVVGVIKNYHQLSLKSHFEPMLFRYPSYYVARFLILEVGTGNISETINGIQDNYQASFPNDPFRYFFLDDHFNRQYQEDARFGNICLIFSILTIIIATLGLFGLATYMAIQKRKEIGIRKVLGASNLQIIWLLPRNIVHLVLIASIIAIPIAYLLVNQWLERFAFETSLEIWMFMFPVCIVFGVTILSVLRQSVMSMLVNPADSLRDD